MKKNLFLCLVVALLPLMAMADVKYTIYPIPQKAEYGKSHLLFNNEFNVVAESGIDSYTIARLKEVFEEENSFKLTFSKKPSSKISNIYLGIKGSGGMVDKYAAKTGLSTEVFGKKGKYDRHAISVRISPKRVPEIIVLGEHTNAVFYALASLEQMLEQSYKAQQGVLLGEAEIADYADMQYRGVVEGYYGYPYSFDVKKDLMRFFKRFKMNTYLYGAKSDPYHSGFWRDAYPENINATQEKNGWLSQQMIKDLSALSLETKVNFIWAIHPNSGKAVSYRSAESTRKAVDDVMGKFDKMHDLGVRQFAVFLDDAGWDFNDVDNYRDFLINLQKDLENKYNKNYTNASDTVMPIHYVPHVYAINFASKEGLKTYFDAIAQTPSNIVVYTTGSGVWSSVKNEDFVTMENLMKRPVALWWNYPCNDNKDGRIYTADMYSTLTEMGLPIPDKNVPSCLGLVSNPMQQGTVAKICLFGVADYSWNTNAFDTKANWKAAFPAIIGKELAPLYNYLAKYLRYQDPEELGELIKQVETAPGSGIISFRNAAAGQLLNTLVAIRDSVGKMMAYHPTNQTDPLLLRDLEPWLCKLRTMTEMGIALFNNYDNLDTDKKWQVLCEQVKTLDEFKTNPKYMVDALEGMGENPPSVLHRVEPSHKYLMPFLERVINSQSRAYQMYPRIAPTLYKSNGNGLPSSGGAATDGQLDLKSTSTEVAPGDFVTIAMPCAVVEDITLAPDSFKNFSLSVSVLGRQFEKVADAKSIVGKTVQYIRFTNKTKKPQPIEFTYSNFGIKIPGRLQVERITIPQGSVWDRHDSWYLVDGNYNTFTCLGRDQRDGDTYTIKLRKPQPIHDITMAFGTTNLDFPKVGQVQISADSVNWTTLKVEGTDTEDFRMSMPQVKKLNDNVSTCSFTGTGAVAQYVRFVLKEAFQEKWLRLNEFDINPGYRAQQGVSPVTVNGKVYPELFDGKTNVFYVPKTDNEEIIYTFQNIVSPRELVVYAYSESAAAGAEAKVVCPGKTETVATIKSGINKIDMTKYPDATSVVIKANRALQISEISEHPIIVWEK